MSEQHDNDSYERTLADRFWLATWGRFLSDEKRLAQALHYAALTNRLWRAKYLLQDKKAHPDSDDGRAVRLAAEGGHNEMIRLLAHHGADMNAKNGEALLRAAKNGFVATAKTLIENGADIGLQNFKALHVADAANDTAMIRTLLNSGQDAQSHAAGLLKKAEEAGNETKAALYRQYLDAQARPAPGIASFRRMQDIFKPKSP